MRCDREGEARAGLVPNISMVRRSDAEGVISRRQIREEGQALVADLSPIIQMVHRFQTLLELETIGGRETVGGQMKLQDARASWGETHSPGRCIGGDGGVSNDGRRENRKT